MKINRLCKRFASVLLSLSLIAAPLSSSGLNLTSFAAAQEDILNDVVSSYSLNAAEDNSAFENTDSVSEDADSTVNNTKVEALNTVDTTNEHIQDGIEPNTADKSNNSAGDSLYILSPDIKEVFDIKTSFDNADIDKIEREQFEKTSSNPFGLADEDMPSEREDLCEELAAAYGEPDLISLAAENEDNSNVSNESNEGSEPYIVVNEDDAHFNGSFTIKYTTVNNEQKKFKITSAMGPYVNLLYVRYVDADYYGFKVLSISIDVVDENGRELTFYADDISGGDFYIIENIMFSNGDLLAKDLQYCADFEADEPKWSTYKDASLTSGRYSIKVRKPYGTYRALREKVTKPDVTGKALLIALDNDETLMNGPAEDVASIKATLTRTQQFREEDIEIISVPAGTADDYKSEIWKWIDENAASDNELTFIAYSGHGNYHNDGTAELSIGGQNTISGTELKQHVSKLHGKVVMLFDSCYSGGMIMPTMLDGTETELESDEIDINSAEIGLNSNEIELNSVETNVNNVETELEEDESKLYDDMASLADMMEKYQAMQDNASKAFVNEFKNAKASPDTDGDSDYVNDTGDDDDYTNSAEDSSVETAGTKAASKDLKYYIFSAASSDEMATGHLFLGGQITALFNYALGYARTVSSYNIYAADTNADYEISAKELADYIKSSSIESKPTVYYPTSASDDALFSYDEDSGVPAILSIKSVSTKNVTPDADGTVSVDVKLTNHSEEEVTFDAGAVLASNAGENRPGAINPGSYSAEDSEQIFYKEGVNLYSIPAGETKKYTLKFTDTTKFFFTVGGRFIIKIWGTDDTAADSFALTDFYIGKAETAAKVDDAGKAAFAIKEPAQLQTVKEVANGNQVSAIVPLKVVFDTEPTVKSGYAALTLTAKAYYLGTLYGSEASAAAASESYIPGYGVNEDGDLVLNEALIAEGSQEYTDIYVDGETDIYTDVRPTYVRNDVYSMDGAGSCYSYAWDVSDLPEGYYAVQIICNYDEGESQKKTTFIKVSDKKSADESTKLIGESYIGMNGFAAYAYGLRVGDTWKNFGGSISRVTNIFTEYLNYYSYKYDGDTKNITYSIADESAADGCQSGWFILDEDTDSLEAITDPEHTYFESGKSYVNRITLTIDKDYNALFAGGCAFSVTGHELYGGDASGNYKSGVSKDNQKQAVLYVVHKNLQAADHEDDIKVCRAGTKTAITQEDALKAGDKIDVYVPAGYMIVDNSVSGCLKNIAAKGTGYYRFEVIQGEGTEIQFTVLKPFNAKGGDDCCATVLYTHAISDIKDTITGISAPKKTFYNYMDSNTLDLTGAKVTYYTKNESDDKLESKTDALNTFMDDSSAKLYIKNGDKYYEWKDEYLRNFGSYDIYLLYNGAYTKAFDIKVGYTQGDKFSIDGSFTDNNKGEAAYVANDKLKNIVLSLHTDAKVSDSGQGTINVTHDISMLSEYDNASDYGKVYFAEGARIKYLLPYPKGLSYSKTLHLTAEDNNRNVPVTLEANKEGVWVTAYRSGEFTINIDTGGKGGPDEPDAPDEPDSNTNNHSGARNSSGRIANGGSGNGTNSKVYGTWQTDTLRVGSAGAGGVINVNGQYVVPSIGVIEPDGSNNAASAAGTETVTLYRFMMNNGEYATGWKQIEYKGSYKWFFFGNDGYMRVNWAQDDNSWYYLNADGTMATGWIQDKDAWYYLGSDGKMATGWQQIGGKWYYLDADGHMLTGQQTIDGKSYNFREDGSLIQD